MTHSSTCSFSPLAHFDKLHLRRLGEPAEAGLWVTSLPWPRDPTMSLTLGGVPTATFPLGCWPGEDTPRRLLMFGDGGDGIPPKELALHQMVNKSSSARQTPEAKMELFETSPEKYFVWERHLLRIRHGGRSVGLALGLRTGGRVHWWEACGLVVVEETPECLVIEMGGSIPRDIQTTDDLNHYSGYKNPYLHKHNWLSGQIHARLFANGVCEIYAHHINNKFMDDGLSLEDVVPVIGFKVDEGLSAPDDLPGLWDGSRDRFELGGVRFDMSEVARLASSAQPGEVSQEQGFLILQPYEGVELYGGLCPEDRTGDPFIFHSVQKGFPRGMARTLRFSLSLSDRSPKIVRYLAPAWWYGLCEEFLPEPILPVCNEYDVTLELANDFARKNMVRSGFEDGALPRHLACAKELKGRICNEPGWEGEIGYGLFLRVWRTGNGDDYADALRSAYYFTDVTIDHAAKLVRMHGYAPNAFSLPMNRVQATIAAYLETGDPYLCAAAQAVTTNAHWQNKNSWPRMAVGRDACYVRSAVFLYRYFGDEFFRKIALEGAMCVVNSQRPNGSFGDQGGGSGLHQWSGYITKPWMGLLAVNGLLDYLELFPDEEKLKTTVKQFADWLMTERWEHAKGKVWAYQHDYNGLDHHMGPNGQITRFPTHKPWHQDNLARLLGTITFQTGDLRYLDAWAESYAISPLEQTDHSVSAALQFIPWIQAKLWNARLSSDGIEMAPIWFGERTPLTALVMTPEGEQSVTVFPGPDCESPDLKLLRPSIAICRRTVSSIPHQVARD